MDPTRIASAKEWACDVGRTRDGRTDVLEKKHNRIVMKKDDDSSAYSESFEIVESTNWKYRMVRVTHQLPVSQTHWFAVSVR